MLWPVHLKPRPNELTSSWLVRLAIGHGYKLHMFCKGVWGKKDIWNRDIDKLPLEWMFQTLCEKTGTPMEAVRNTHLSSYEGKLYRRHNPNGNTPWIMPIGVYHRLRRSFGQQYCPHCLAEEMYLKKEWRLALVTCCEKHSTVLLDRCPGCHLPVHFHRDDMGHKSDLGRQCPAICFNCKFDLRKAATIQAPAEMLTLQSKWLKAIETGEDIGEASGPDYFDILHHLTTMMLSRYSFCRNIGAHTATAMGIDWVKPQRELNAGIECLSILDRMQLLRMASWLLDEWPQRFIDFGKEHEIWSAALTKDLDVIPAWYGTVVDTYLKREIWKGRPDLKSKRAHNWKPIHKILRNQKLALKAAQCCAG